VHPIDVSLKWCVPLRAAASARSLMCARQRSTTRDPSRPVHATTLTLGAITLSLNDAQVGRRRPL
jgi:hypothetical protein